MPYILWFQAAGIKKHSKTFTCTYICSDNEGNLIARLYCQLRSLQASSPFMATKVRRERTCKQVAKLLGAKFLSCMTFHDVLRWESFAHSLPAEFKVDLTTYVWFQTPLSHQHKNKETSDINEEILSVQNTHR